MGKRDEDSASARVWNHLEQHFCRHALLIERFRHASPPTVVHMWRTGKNEIGECMSQFERSALVERYCELFGIWPK